MMSRVARALSALILATACAACSTDDGAASQSAEEKMCRQVLGEEALTWLEKDNGSRSLRLSSYASTEEIASQAQKRVKSWMPGTSNELAPLFYEQLCRVESKVGGKHGDFGIYFMNTYGALPKKEEAKYEKTVIYPLTSTAVAIKHPRDEKDSVLFTCKIPDSYPAQEKNLPMRIFFAGDLYLDQSRLEDRYNMLLHASRVMAEALGCQNDVQIPEKFPAAAK